MFGASISAGYGGLWDGVVAHWDPAHRYYGANLNPIAELQRYYGSSWSINISEMVNSRGGALQLRELLATKRGRTVLAQSSLMGSGDAFYWQAVRSRAPNCEDVVEQVEYVISVARSAGKPLILGNLPIERPDNVDPILKMAGWSPPRIQCVRAVNKRLSEACKPETQCYLLDIYSMIEEMNRGCLVIETRDEYRRVIRKDCYPPTQVRFDGVHLSPVGRYHVMNLIEDQLLANPPACVGSNSAN